jgi:hypothetical protein
MLELSAQMILSKRARHALVSAPAADMEAGTEDVILSALVHRLEAGLIVPPRVSSH